MSDPQNYDWKNIHPDFTNQLQAEWAKQRFSYWETKEWISIGFTPQDAKYCAWLRDEKKVDANWALNYGDREQLLTEYNNKQSKPSFLSSVRSYLFDSKKEEEIVEEAPNLPNHSRYSIHNPNFEVPLYHNDSMPSKKSILGIDKSDNEDASLNYFFITNEKNEIVAWRCEDFDDDWKNAPDSTLCGFTFDLEPKHANSYLRIKVKEVIPLHSYSLPVDETILFNSCEDEEIYNSLKEKSWRNCLVVDQLEVRQCICKTYSLPPNFDECHNKECSNYYFLDNISQYSEDNSNPHFLVKYKEELIILVGSVIIIWFLVKL